MEENLKELIKTDNVTILNFGKNARPKPIKSKIIKLKPIFRTKECTDRPENSLNECANALNIEDIVKVSDINLNIYLREEH
jgi:hypothetical protein